MRLPARTASISSDWAASWDWTASPLRGGTTDHAAGTSAAERARVAATVSAVDGPSFDHFMDGFPLTEKK
jgi:hypothetical protein